MSYLAAHSRIVILLLLALLAFPSLSLAAAPKPPDYNRMIRQCLREGSDEAEQAEEALIASRDPAAAAALFASLKASDPRIRSKCATLIGARKDTGAGAVLAALLHDRDKTVRQYTLIALEVLRDPSTLPAIAGVLQDKEPFLRTQAVREMGYFGPPAIELLTQALKHKDRSVRREAVRTLGKINDPRIVPLLAAQLQNTDLNDTAVYALGGIGRPALEPLLGALPAAQSSLRRSIIKQLSRIHDPRAREAVYAACGDADAQIRAEAVKYLNPAVAKELDLLFAALRDPRYEVTLNARMQLEYAVLDRRAVDALLPLLSNADGRISWVAAVRLAEFRDPRMVEPLLARLQQPECPRMVVTALGNQRDLRAVPILIGLLGEAPSGMDLEDPDNLCGDKGEEAVEALAKIGEPAMEPLLAVWKSGNRWARLRALRALGGLDDPRILPILFTAMQDTDKDVRLAAIYKLAIRNDARTWDRLIPLLTDKDAEIRRAAAGALQDCIDPRMVEPLIKMFGSRDEEERRAAVYAIGGQNDPRVPALMARALKDRDEFVRYAAIWTDGPWVNDPRALEALLTAFKDGHDDIILDRLAGADTRVLVPALLRTARSRDVAIRQGAVKSLGSHPSPAVTAALLAALDDREKDVRVAACEALGQVRDLSVIPEIVRRIKATKDSESWYSLLAILGELGPPAADALLALLAATEEQNTRNSILWELAQTRSPAAVDPLLAALKSQDDSWLMFYDLGELDDPRVADALIDYIQDPEAKSLGEAVAILGKLKDKRAVEPLLKLAASKDNRVVPGEIILALRSIGDPRVREVALHYLDDEIALSNPHVLMMPDRLDEAILAVGEFGNEQDLARLTELLERYVYDTAGQEGHLNALTEALAVRGGERARELIAAAFREDRGIGLVAAVQALTDPDEARSQEMLQAALATLAFDSPQDASAASFGTVLRQARNGQERVRLEAAVRSDDWATRSGSLVAMAVIGESWAIPPALQALSDSQPRVRANAAEALGQLKAKEAVPALTKALADLYPYVRKAAKAALAAIEQ